MNEGDCVEEKNLKKKQPRRKIIKSLLILFVVHFRALYK